jgi:hypothetical protein
MQMQLGALIAVSVRCGRSCSFLFLGLFCCLFPLAADWVQRGVALICSLSD